jgi:hypothetical protein
VTAGKDGRSVVGALPATRIRPLGLLRRLVNRTRAPRIDVRYSRSDIPCGGADADAAGDPTLGEVRIISID